jgi:putative addiction module component (TIGR02574 family)
MGDDFWDSIAPISEPLHFTSMQRDELDRRLEDMRQNPNDGSPWNEVKKRILENAPPLK